MAIEVRIPTILRSYTGGSKSVEGDGQTLAALLDDLDRRYAGLRGRLVTDDGKLHRFVNVYINDEDVRFLGGLDAKLAEGAMVTILPAVAGGAPARAGIACGAAAGPAAAGPAAGAAGHVAGRGAGAALSAGWRPGES